MWNIHLILKRTHTHTHTRTHTHAHTYTNTDTHTRLYYQPLQKLLYLVSFQSNAVPHPNARYIVVKCTLYTYLSFNRKNDTPGLGIVLSHLMPLWPNTKLFHLLIAKLFTPTTAIGKNVWLIRVTLALC